MIQIPEKPLLRRRAASAFLESNWGIPCKPRTLAKLATVGGGPVFAKSGRIPLYDESDLNAWAAAKLGPKVSSTSQNAS